MSKKLLLADDSITIQKVIGITFANEDYALEIVDNGDAALERAQADRPDLVLADVYMPGRNGYELCEAIKSDADLAGVPVLLLTGTFEPFDEERAAAVGADEWIAKPFESQALIDKVEELLARGAQAPPAKAGPAPPEAPEPARPTAPEPRPETAIEEEPDFESLLETSEEEPLDEPQTWAKEPEQAVDEPVLGEEEFEPAEEEEDLWGSVSLEEESLMEEFAEEEPVGEDLWGSLNEELGVTEPETEEPPAEPSEPQAPFGARVEGEEEVYPLDETDILEAEELPEGEGEEDSILGEGAGGFESQEAGAGGESAEPEEFSFEDEEDLFLDEGGIELSAEESLISPAEALTEQEQSFEEPEPEEEPLEQAKPAATADTPAAAAVEQQVQSLSEEDLNRIVEQVASRVLEKIAWEVVPDLAETLIKDEIRKIREGGE